MGAVDGFDGVAAGVFDSPTWRIHSYQQPLMFSLVLMCVRNCLACWRLANLKEELGEDAWPGLAIYIRHLRDSTSFNRFVLEMAAGVLQHKGFPPDVHAAAAANAGGTGVRDESTDTDDTVGILQVGTTVVLPPPAATNAWLTRRVVQVALDACKQSQARRAWFRGEHGKRFRSYCSAAFPHFPVRGDQKRWCVMCSRTISVQDGGEGTAGVRRNKRRRVGRQTKFYCGTCGVGLCHPSSDATVDRTCFNQWHKRDAEL